MRVQTDEGEFIWLPLAFNGGYPLGNIDLEVFEVLAVDGHAVKDAIAYMGGFLSSPSVHLTCSCGVSMTRPFYGPAAKFTEQVALIYAAQYFIIHTTAEQQAAKDDNPIIAAADAVFQQFLIQNDAQYYLATNQPAVIDRLREYERLRWP